MNRRAALAETLRTATIMVSAPGRVGTGFFVAPGQVLTCAHVVAGRTRKPPERMAGQWGDADLELEVMQFRPDHDLALLRVVGELDHPVACLATPMEPGDELWACGHPDGTYRRGDVIRSIYDGPSVDADGLELLRVTEGRAVEGFTAVPCSTGAPVEYAGSCVVLTLHRVAHLARGLSEPRAFLRSSRASSSPRQCRLQTAYRGFGCWMTSSWQPGAGVIRVPDFGATSKQRG